MKTKATAKQLSEVNISDIDFSDKSFQNRDTLSIEELAKSLAQDGQQVPVELRKRDGKYQIVCGFRRCNALKHIGKNTVLAFIHKGNTSEDDLHKLSLIENLQRETLSDLEKIDACAAMVSRNMAKKELATIYNVGVRTIENYVRISTKASAPVRAAISDGLLTIHQAAPLIGKSASVIQDVLSKSKEENLSVSRIRKMIEGKKKAGMRKPKQHFKAFKHGFNLSLKYRDDFDIAEKAQIRETLESALSKIK